MDAGRGVECPRCGRRNSPGAAFCDRCGTRLAPPAPHTPKDLAEGILTSRTALEGERKHVTVLFADLKGSLELLADRDPEDARKILDPVLEHMMAAVHRFEGTVNQVMGDGIMALFGAPLAHEDHAVRACYAALAMQARVKRYADEVRRSEGAVVKIRVGLNSGEVVVRTIGSDLRMDYSAVGQTTHLAARMEQLAEPGTIVITPATLALAEGRIEVEPVGPVAVRGYPTPLDVYELTGARPSRTRLQATAARRGLTRFVGRDVELDTLRQALDRARLGEGQVVAVVGEPGVGKSRLVHEFVRSHRLADWLVLEAAAVSYGTATSYGPVVEWLRRYFKIGSRDDLRTVREKVTGKLLTLDRTLESARPSLLMLLDVPFDDAGWHSLDPRERRDRTLEALRALWSREAREQPLLLIVEDLHWIDAESQAVLDALVDGLGSSRVLLLVNFRPEYSPPWSHDTRVRMDALGAGSIDAFLDALVGTDAALADLKRLLIERTEGNPFFLEESVGSLVDTGALVGGPGAYRQARSVETLEIPESVHALLAARIDRLPEREKAWLEAAAVVGQDVPFPVLREIVEASESDLRRGLAHLQAAGFLDEAALFPELEYAFRHALTHDVAYGNLLQARRRALHARVVEALERVHGDRLAEQVERLAAHALKGELWAKAAGYLRQAGNRAALRSAYQEALGAFEQALGALVHLPESRDTTIQAIDLRLDLRAALAPLGHYARILDGMREAETLAREVGDRRRLGLVLADLGARLRNVGDHQRALEASRQALEIAAELPDRGLVIEAKYRLAQARFAVGDLAPAEALFRETAEALGDEGATTRAGLPWFFAAWPRAWLGLVCSHLGRFTEAIGYAEDAVRIAEAANHPHTVIEAYSALGGVNLERGDLPAALRVFEHGRLLLQARKLGDPNLLSGLGYAYVLSGRVREGLDVLEASLVGEASISAMGLGLAVRVSRVADAYRRAGRADEALERSRAAVDLGRTHGERANEASALKILADVLSHDERLDAQAAEQAYAQGLALAETLGMRPLVAHCHAGIAGLRRRTGKRQDAQEHLALATTLYRELGMGSWLERATEQA
jgi:class 3 adenylate cyclase/tetratricopeptide (TPR) repeat protein